MSAMSKLHIVFLLSFLCQFALAQECDLVKEMTENYIRIRQKSGTEELLKEWLKDLPIQEDTIYALLYVPMDCPRCEAAITNFWLKLKDEYPNQKMVLITAYQDSLLAKGYNKRCDYKADAYLYDTTEFYRQIFNTNMSGGLMGLHILKIDRKRGDLLVGGQYTVLNKLFIKQLIEYKGMLKKTSFPSDVVEKDEAYVMISEAIPQMKKFIDLKIDSTVNISTLFDTPRYIDGKLFFTDVLQNGVMLFKEYGRSMNYMGLLQVDSIERKRFINIPDKVYQYYKDHNMLFYIALGANMLDDKYIGISYSIPRVVADGAENSYGLYNAPVIIKRDINSLSAAPMIMLDFNLENDTTFFYTHFQFSKHQDNIVIGCKKHTWPMEYDREDYENIPNMNPFDNRFYQTNNPYIATFNAHDGTLTGHLGCLGTSHVKSLTGYYFTRPISYSSGKELVYTNGYDGSVSVVLEDGSEKIYHAFEIDAEQFPIPDTCLFYTYECVKPYTRFFNRCVTDIKIDKKNLYCIVKYAKPDSDEGTRYVYTVINRKNGKITQKVIPQSNEHLLGCGLATKKRRIFPFTLQKGHETVIRLFR